MAWFSKRYQDLRCLSRKVIHANDDGENVGEGRDEEDDEDEVVDDETEAEEEEDDDDCRIGGGGGDGDGAGEHRDLEGALELGQCGVGLG